MSATILFDGVCNLCNGFVQFVIARDPHARFRFAALGSPAAEEMLRRADVAGPVPDSIVLIEGERAWFRSDAALRIARGLPFPWPLASACLIVPRFIRDAVYDAIARRRYRWFGRRDTCMVPTPELTSRFL